MNYFLIFLLILNVLAWLCFFVAFRRKYSPESVLHGISQETAKIVKGIIRVSEQCQQESKETMDMLRALMRQSDEKAKSLQETANSVMREVEFFAAMRSMTAEAGNPAPTAPKTRRRKEEPEKAVEKTESNLFSQAVGEGKFQKNVFAENAPKIVGKKNILKPIDAETQIKRYYERGLTADEISKSLDVPVGNVEFVLGFEKMLNGNADKSV